MLDRLHESDQESQTLTAEQANSSGARWTAEEEQYILEHSREPAG